MAKTPPEGDRWRTIVAMILSRAAGDETQMKRLRESPNEVLTAEGVTVPPGIEIRVVRNTPAAHYLDLAAPGAGEAIRRVLPRKSGEELRLVRSTAKERYLIVPAHRAPSSQGGQLPEDAVVATSTAETTSEQLEITTVIDSFQVVVSSIEQESLIQIVIDGAVALESVSG